jgi:hypothetical protein
MTSSIQLKRDTTANWVSSNRVLLDGEEGIEEKQASLTNQFTVDGGLR